MAKHIRIVLTDDHFAIRGGVKQLLEKEDDFLVVGEAADGLEALDVVAELKPNVLIADLTMPKLNGVELIKRIKKKYARVRLVVFSMLGEDRVVAESMQSGALGYVLKGGTDGELIKAIRSVVDGKHFLSRDLRGKGLDFYLNYQLDQDPIEGVLTKREREVLQMVVEGRTNQEIANLLNISSRTVEAHRANLMNKLEIHNTSDLIRFAIRQGIISIDG